MATAEQLTAGFANRLSQQIGWYDLVRNEALAQFAATGLPTPRHEDWKYTSLAAVRDANLLGGEASVSSTGAPHIAPMANLATWVLADGLSVEARGTFALEGVDVRPLAEAVRDDSLEGVFGSIVTGNDPLDALNTAMHRDGVVITATGSGSLRVVHLAQQGASHARSLVIAKRGARLVLVEEHIGEIAGTLANPVTEIIIEDGAEVRLVRLIDAEAGSFHLGSVHVRLGRDARFTYHGFAVGGQITRTRITTTLATGSTAEMSGITLAGRDQHHDVHLTLDHAAPHASSSQAFRGVVAERGRSVFTGKVIVRPQAQKTDAAQNVRHLLLHEDAWVNARPQLEILADDVKCSHGATVGRLNEESLFFLRSRGLSLPQARALLVEAFASETLGKVPDEALRDALDVRIRRRLASLEGGEA